MADVADRLRAQTGQYTQERLRQQAGWLEDQLKLERDSAQKAADLAEKTFEELRQTMDTLIEFIVLNHGDIPETLMEIIAARQEQRIAKSLKGGMSDEEKTRELVMSSPTFKSAQDGQILRMGAGGKLGFAQPPTALEVQEDLIRRLAQLK
jgi:hypothetical protein